MQGFLLQVEVAEIVLHEADDPYTLVDLLDADALTGGFKLDQLCSILDTLVAMRWQLSDGLRTGPDLPG